MSLEVEDIATNLGDNRKRRIAWTAWNNHKEIPSASMRVRVRVRVRVRACGGVGVWVSACVCADVCVCVCVFDKHDQREYRSVQEWLIPL